MQLFDRGYDLFEGLGINRDPAQTQQVNLIYASSGHPPVHESDTLTLHVGGNFVASAQLTIDVYVQHYGA